MYLIKSFEDNFKGPRSSKKVLFGEKPACLGKKVFFGAKEMLSPFKKIEAKT